LRPSLLIKGVDIRAKEKGNFVLTAERQCLPAPRAAAVGIREGSPSSPSSPLVLWGRSLVISWFISHCIFPVTIHLPVPLACEWRFQPCFIAGDLLLEIICWL